MRRYDLFDGREVERPDIDSFLEEVVDVCKKHGFSISHEDREGSFEIVDYDDCEAEWLMGASVWTSKR